MVILLTASPVMWNERWFAMSYVLLSETLFAVGAVGFLSMAMPISWTRSAATVFTTYLTLSNVSHVVGNWTVGSPRTLLKFGDGSEAANMTSCELTLWFVGLITLAPLLLLIVVRSNEVDRARQAEAPPQAST